MPAPHTTNPTTTSKTAREALRLVSEAHMDLDDLLPDACGDDGEAIEYALSLLRDAIDVLGGEATTYPIRPRGGEAA